MGTHDIYTFVTGPGAWISVALFLCGMLYKLVRIIRLTLKKDQQLLKILSLRFTYRSLIHWLTPFATASSRQHPVMCLFNMALHALLLITPVFLLSHLVLLNQHLGISWPALPDWLADLMTVGVICGCLILGIRRFVKPEVRFVTSASDWLALILTVLPFITGFLAYHQFFNYPIMMILHIISGEVLLVAIPLTRLSHMFYALFIRACTASEFGGVRYARDW